MSRLKTLVVVGMFLWPSPGQSQALQPESLPAPQAGRPVSFGSLQIFPSLSIRDVGMDSNVYNSSLVIREDFTYTLAPRVMAEMPVGNGRVVGTGGAGFVFFRTNKDQQSLNASATGLYDIRTGRVRPSVEVGINRSRQRGGDIDVRALSVSRNGRAALEVGVSGITSLTAWAARDNTEFAPGQAFRGVDLAAQLNRKTTTFAAGVRLDLTPLTSVVAAAEFEQIRFTTSRYRDSDSLRLTPTVRFGEGAIINGQAFVGVRDFRPVQPVMAPFRGLVAGGDLRYTLLGVTRFEGRLTRDIVYSFDELQPYYLDAGGQLTVSQRVVGPVDAIVLAGRRTLQYEARLDLGVDGRRETVTIYGGGVGVRVDDNMRMTFTVDREKRASSGPVQREYERTRAFVALEYQP
jgi:hypothetical protein